MKLLIILASQAATAIENSQLLQVSIAKKSIDHQMEMAREIQIQLLPKKMPYVTGLDLEFLSVPAKEMGGDYCDVIDIKEKDLLAVTIGDVSGKDIPASLLMVMVRSFIKIEAIDKVFPQKVLSELNELIIADNKAYSDIFITLFYGVINKKNFMLTYSNAGHDPAYLFHRNTGTFETLKTGDLLLGIFHNSTYHENTIQLQNEDLLILYTDGIIEASNHKHDCFGEERFIRTVFKNISKPCGEIKDAIYNEVIRFSGQNKLKDDIALLVIDINFKKEDETYTCTDVCRNALTEKMVITYMDKWFSSIVHKAAIRVLKAMKDKNIISEKINFEEIDVENIFLKRSLEDTPSEQNNNSKILKLNLKAMLDYIFIVDIINEELALVVGFDTDTASEWMIAIKEAVINAITYGTDFDRDDWVGIYYQIEKDKLIVCVRDHGKGFDINKIKDPRDKSVIFSDHGRGLLLIKGFMDEVKFDMDPCKGTEVSMLKFIPSADKCNDKK
ncbi:SpoIIE family protein phosphatase [Candidatus Desantisbacteria bacterium]|nr:SpoIIE family protein phosphatase [Candidatus Desantisbacteria bacterium]